MNLFVLYVLLLKATVTSFSGLASLPMIREDLVVRRAVLTDRELNAAVAAGQMGPGPYGLYVVSVGYFVAGFPGAVCGWLAMVTPAFLIIPMLRYAGRRAESPRIRSAVNAVTLAAAGLIVSSTIPLARDALTSIEAVAIAVASCALMLFTRLDTAWIIAGAAAAGLASGFIG
ncbi:MAG TPA: chromate transporter [Bryobacteraceae bacterium]|nr:chromate transporter [Bryobacteraceae bacterium]